MNEFINRFTTKYRNPDEAFLQECKSVFTDTIGVIYQVIGEDAFRPRQAINAAVFDSVMIGLANRLVISSERPDPDAIRHQYASLLANEEYLRLVLESTSHEGNVKERIRKSIECFNAI